MAAFTMVEEILADEQIEEKEGENKIKFRLEQVQVQYVFLRRLSNCVEFLLDKHRNFILHLDQESKTHDDWISSNFCFQHKHCPTKSIFLSCNNLILLNTSSTSQEDA